MFKYILFDMDGTLLHFDHDEFAREYFTLLGAKLAHLVEPKRLIQQLLFSTEEMVKNLDKNKTNEQVFWDHFTRNLNISADVLIPVVDQFYAQDFGMVRRVTKSDINVRKILNTVIGKGKGIVVATNPIFPMAAVKQRLEWAGVADIPFHHITSYEKSHFCKPNVEYYQEILQQIACRPEECLMIGNDVEEDLAAGKIGIKTYLVTDNVINSKGLEPKADYISTLAELAANIEKLLSGD
ncbi:MAG: gph [Firmicutes bacterium]|nr:gph [Bacillota bacterium]